MDILNANDVLDAERWKAWVEHSAWDDAYYLPQYACATATLEQTDPIAVVGGLSSSKILAPLLIRRLSVSANGTSMSWLDAASPYGYGGQLSLSASGLADVAALRAFFNELHDWCSSQGIVCCVMRLHPVIAQQEWFAADMQCKGTLHMHLQRATASIDCKDWDDELDLPKQMHHGRHEDMRLARRALRATWMSGEDIAFEAALKIFVSLYRETLARRGADSFYNFPPSYFSLLTKLGKRIGLFIAWCGDEPAGANITLIGSKFAHGHLAGTNELGRKHGAATLLNIEEARWARRSGCRLLHLGGGMRPGDGMEKYKSSYRGPQHVYRYLTYVVDREKFEHIRRLPDAPWPYNLPSAKGNVE